eukprot:351652-Chlamydomonas_euryale.AAC.5
MSGLKGGGYQGRVHVGGGGGLEGRKAGARRGQQRPRWGSGAQQHGSTEAQVVKCNRTGQGSLAPLRPVPPLPKSSLPARLLYPSRHPRGTMCEPHSRRSARLRGCATRTAAAPASAPASTAALPAKVTIPPGPALGQKVVPLEPRFTSVHAQPRSPSCRSERSHPPPAAHANPSETTARGSHGQRYEPLGLHGTGCVRTCCSRSDGAAQRARSQLPC